MNLRYLRYVLRHKWHVMLACFAEGLFWRGIRHDWHKFLPSEWAPYVEHFYGGHDTDDDVQSFDYAWLRHIHRADHHWQWWSLIQDDGPTLPLPMSRAAMVEMLCDWKGASASTGGRGRWSDVKDWWNKHKDNFRIHKLTERAIDEFLDSRITREEIP